MATVPTLDIDEIKAAPSLAFKPFLRIKDPEDKDGNPVARVNQVPVTFFVYMVRFTGEPQERPNRLNPGQNQLVVEAELLQCLNDKNPFGKRRDEKDAITIGPQEGPCQIVISTPRGLADELKPRYPLKGKVVAFYKKEPVKVPGRGKAMWRMALKEYQGALVFTHRELMRWVYQGTLRNQATI